MSIESFNPSNPEYKEVKDLPQEEQKNFADVEGGFVGERAVRYKEAAEVVAKRINTETADHERRLDEVDDFFGTPSSAEIKNYLGIPRDPVVKSMDVLHQVAKEEDQKRGK